ncbi:anti sigma factor C-terminal domain-containing protein [Clostridium sp.]
MTDNLDELFDEKKLNKAIKKGKLKSSLRTALISLFVAIIVITLGSYFNTKISLNLSEQYFNDNQDIVKLSVPNGSIRQYIDNIGILGGKITYKVSKSIGYKSIVFGEGATVFNYFLNNRILNISTYSNNYPVTRHSGGYTVPKIEDEWYISYLDNGYRSMMFFHPKIKYKGYKDDLSKLDEISDDQLIELAISFDKPYKDSQIQSMLGNKVNLSWYWLDAFSNEFINEQLEDAKNKGAYIDEVNTIGVNVNSQNFKTGYTELMQLLKNTRVENYKTIYNDMMENGYKDYKSYTDVPVLGAIVYGTKSELKVLIGNPAIKASSFGVITSKY